MGAELIAAENDYTSDSDDDELEYEAQGLKYNNTMVFVRNLPSETPQGLLADNRVLQQGTGGLREAPVPEARQGEETQDQADGMEA